MAGLGREQALAAMRRGSAGQALEVPEWGGTVWLRPWSVADAERYVALARKLRDGEEPGMNLSAFVVLHCVTDEQGAPLFTEADAAELAKASAPVVERIVRRAMKLNRVEEGAAEGN